MTYNILDLYGDMYICECELTEISDDMYFEYESNSNALSNVFNRIITAIKNFFTNLIEKLRAVFVGNDSMVARIKKEFETSYRFKYAEIMVPDLSKIQSKLNKRIEICDKLVKRGILKKATDEAVADAAAQCSTLMDSVRQLQTETTMVKTSKVYTMIMLKNDSIIAGCKRKCNNLIEITKKLESAKISVNAKVAQLISTVECENTQVISTITVKMINALYSAAKKFDSRISGGKLRRNADDNLDAERREAARVHEELERRARSMEMDRLHNDMINR